MYKNLTQFNAKYLPPPELFFCLRPRINVFIFLFISIFNYISIYVIIAYLFTYVFIYSFIHLLLLFVDIDECATRNNDCKFNQICMNTAGGYSCSCPRGYRSSGPNRPCVGKALSYLSWLMLRHSKAYVAPLLCNLKDRAAS